MSVFTHTNHITKKKKLKSFYGNENCKNVGTEINLRKAFNIKSRKISMHGIFHLNSDEKRKENSFKRNLFFTFLKFKSQSGKSNVKKRKNF